MRATRARRDSLRRVMRAPPADPDYAGRPLRWLLLLVFGASLAGVFWFFLRGAEEGAGAQPELDLLGPAEPAAEASAPARRPAGGAASPETEPPRGKITPDAAFEEEMRSRYGALSVGALGEKFQVLRQQVGLEASKIGQPQILVSGMELGEVDGLAPDVLVYRGPDAERRMRAVVLSREDYPQLTYKHREAVWLQREISRRQEDR